jgi:hypothetical protein
MMARDELDELLAKIDALADDAEQILSTFQRSIEKTDYSVHRMKILLQDFRTALRQALKPTI